MQSLKRNEADTIASVLQQPVRGKLNIVNINGPGGIGKTFLWEYVTYHMLSLPDLRYLVLPIDGSTADTRYDFIGMLQQGLSKSASFKRKGEKDPRFDRLNKLIAQTKALDERIKLQITQAKTAPDIASMDESSKQEYAELAGAMVRQGTLLNAEVYQDVQKIIQIAATLANVFFPAAKAATFIKLAPTAAIALQQIVPECVSLYEKLTTYMQDLATNFHETMAKGLCHDLKSTYMLLDGWGRPVYERFVLVLDDYEVTARSLQSFVLNKLLPRLENREHGFEDTVVVVIGRQPIDLDPDWQRLITRNRFTRIDLKQFSEEECKTLLRNAGCPLKDEDRIYRETEGVPYLVIEALQNLQSKTEGMASYEEAFVNRTTQWMTPQEERWFRHIAYLDVINLVTVRCLFGSVPGLEPQDAEAAFHWFMSEPSIREPFADSLIVRRIVRNKFLKVRNRIDPESHASMTAIAQDCCQP